MNDGRFASRLPNLVAAGQLLAVAATLLGSLGYQFVLGELPCPLCVIQRLAFLLACVGPLGILGANAAGRCSGGEQARGFAMTIFASLAGAAASIRQILLHIVPPDAGYGPPVLGLHLYSWALIVFACLIASSAIGLLSLRENPSPLPRLVINALTGSVVGIAVIIALATFAMEGFAFLLPPDPVRYELFHLLGR